MLVRNSLLQLLGKFVPGLIGFAAVGVLTRLLVPEEFGVYGLVTAVIQLLVLGGFSWLGVAVVRLAAGQDDSEIRPAAFALHTLIIAAIALVGLAVFIADPTREHASIIVACIVGAAVLGYFDLRGSFFIARGEYVSSMAQGVARGALAPAGAIAAALLGFGGAAVSLAYSLAALPAALLTSGKIGFPISYDWKTIRRIAAFGLPLAGSIGLFALPTFGDRVVLNHLSGTAVVGLYAAATIIIQNSLTLAASAIGSAGLPLAVHAYESGVPGAAERQLGHNLVALLAFMAPAALGLCLLAPSIAEVLVGTPYREAVVTLTPYLAVAAVISGIRGNYVDHCFHLTKNPVQLVWTAALMAVVNFVSLVILVPRYAHVGAAMAAALTAAVGLVHGILRARRFMRLVVPAPELLKIAAGLVAMSIAVEAVAQYRGAAVLLGQILVGALAYVAAALTFNLMSIRNGAAVALGRLHLGRLDAP
jgi:O-antigen/teichoic acid export membrane protein